METSPDGQVTIPATTDRFSILGLLLLAYVGLIPLLAYLPGMRVIPHAVSALAACVLALGLLARRARMVLTPEILAALGFWIFSLTGVLLVEDMELCLVVQGILLQSVAMFVVVVSVVSTWHMAERMATVIVLAAVTTALVGLAGISTYEGPRAASILGNPNSYGLLLMWSLAVTSFLWFSMGRRRSRWLLLIPLPPFVHQILATGSRKAILGAVLIGAFTVILGLRKLWRQGKSGMTLIVVIAAALLAALILVCAISSPPEELQELGKAVVTGDASELGASIVERLALASAAFRVWKDHPLIGAGAGQFRHLAPRYGEGLRQTYSHCNYLELLANHGLIGFVLHYSFFVILLRRLLRLRIRHFDRRLRAIRDTMIMMLVLHLVLQVAWVTYTDWIAWLALAVVVAVTQLLASETERRARATLSSLGRAEGG